MSTTTCDIRIARELTAARVRALLAEHETVRVTLADLAAAWNPAAPPARLLGPATLTYTRDADGAICLNGGKAK